MNRVQMERDNWVNEWKRIYNWLKGGVITLPIHIATDWGHPKVLQIVRIIVLNVKDTSNSVKGEC